MALSSVQSSGIRLLEASHLPCTALANTYTQAHSLTSLRLPSICTQTASPPPSAEFPLLCFSTDQRAVVTTIRPAKASKQMVGDRPAKQILYKCHHSITDYNYYSTVQNILWGILTCKCLINHKKDYHLLFLFL